MLIQIFTESFKGQCHSGGFKVEGFASWLLPRSCRFAASSFFLSQFHSCATETRLNTKSSWAHFDRSVFCWNGFCWQKSKHLEQLGWFWQNLGVEAKWRNQVWKTLVFQHIQDFHLLCKRKKKDQHKKIPHCFWCDLLSPMLWQSGEGVGQTTSPGSQSSCVHRACCTFKPLRACLQALKEIQKWAVS